MRPRSLWIVLCLALVLAADSKADDKGTKDQPTPTLKFLGKVVRLNGSNKSLTVELTESIIVVDRYQAGRILYWEQRLIDAQRDRNPTNRLKRTQEAQNWIVYHQASLYRRHDQHQNVDLQAADDVQVRTLQLPPVFDDKGNPHKRTADELKKLKGPDSKLLGYTAEFVNLKPGQIVEVTLGKVKTSGMDKTSSKDSPGAMKPADDKGTNLKPLVIMLVIAK
jgi:hypothetical protein